MKKEKILKEYLQEAKLIGYENGDPLTPLEERLIELAFEYGWATSRESTLEEVKEIVNETNPLKQSYYKRRYGQ